jgi:hypothetical protein
VIGNRAAGAARSLRAAAGVDLECQAFGHA